MDIKTLLRDRISINKYGATHYQVVVDRLLQAVSEDESALRAIERGESPIPDLCPKCGDPCWHVRDESETTFYCHCSWCGHDYEIAKPEVTK